MVRYTTLQGSCNVMRAQDGVFCRTPRKGIFQQYASKMAMRTTPYVSDVSEYIRLFENRILRH
jgi:hypothetical protein